MTANDNRQASADTPRAAMPAKIRQAIEELAQQTSEPRPMILPGRIALAEIKVIPELFQPRSGMSEDHVQELARALRDRDDLDPVLIMQVGRWPVLIDGHHRVAAYQRTKGLHAIPVRYFGGTVPEAITASGLENSKAKLPMTLSDRQDYAWRLTKMGLHSLSETKRAASIGRSQAAIMRGVLKKLGAERAAAIIAWIDAKRFADNMDGEGREVDDGYLEALARSYADRLYKEFGSKLTGNIEICARVMELHLGPEKADELAAILGDRRADDESEALGQPF